MAISKKVTWKSLGDKVVAVKVETGEYYTMNEVASMIWKQLAEEKTPREIAEKICEEYDNEDLDSVLKDVEEQISEWQQEGLV